MTIDEKNLHGVPISGAFLTNRLIWVSISLISLVVVYFGFSFSMKNEKAKKEKKKTITPVTFDNSTQSYTATNAGKFSVSGLWYFIRVEVKAIIKNPTFIIIVLLGIINLITSLTSFTGRYGTLQYLVTYNIVDAIRGAFFIFMIAIITFYTGVLVWKERDVRINEIQDSTPIKTSVLFLSKLLAMIVAIVIVQSCTILIGVIAQTISGYYRF